ncbi:MAG: SIR2 family protein [Rhodopila sp.]
MPDEILTARDEGRVLFFCGAGVSRENAKLPDFFGLARAVLAKLRALPDSPASKLVEASQNLGAISGVGSVIAADRIFGLLERDFSVSDIERAVGDVLRPPADVNLRAHRILLDLCRTTDGKVRLVTTNFDLLFESAAPKATVWTPARLPQFREVASFDGIVHLHGVFDKAYQVPVGGSFVLSSAEFGRAYLAEGWATGFIRNVMDNYRIVFVGYAADDPPVQYLLEALSRSAYSNPSRLYAFQSGRPDEAQALWSQKGVTAIAYDSTHGHSPLWNTLSAWAERARNPARWQRGLLRRGKKGPQALQPHERGQVVHLAMTEEGARAIAKSALPASWLCSFDPAMRYARAARVNFMEKDSPSIDPFADYGLDSDMPSDPAKRGAMHAQIEVPPDAINALGRASVDQPVAAGRLRGPSPLHTTELPPRLQSIAMWFHSVCDQPAAIWWAAGQSGLHPKMVELITFALEQKKVAFEIRQAWHYLFECWKLPRQPDYTSAIALQAAIAKDGWTGQNRRRYTEVFRPALTATRSVWRGHYPAKGGSFKLRDLVGLDVSYPDRHVAIDVPAEQLSNVIPLSRQNLELAVDLEREVSPYTVPNVASIDPDSALVGVSSERSFGINVPVFEYIILFKRLVSLDPALAWQELEAWRRDGDPVFGRLRVWACRLPGFLDDSAACEILAGVHDNVFWGFHDQRDVLLALRDLWNRMSSDVKARIEDRVIKGPPRCPRFSAADNRRHKAWTVHERIEWLRQGGCTISKKLDRSAQRLAAQLREAAKEGAAHAADSRDSRGGSVITDKSFGDVDAVPIADLISWAIEGRSRTWGELKEFDPFAGLSEKRPVRLLAALRWNTLQGKDVSSAWGDFLHSNARRTDKPGFAALIARRLAALPLAGIVRAASNWLESAHKLLFGRDREAFEIISDKLVDALASEAAPRGAGEKRRWPDEAVGSAVGHLCDALFGDPLLAEIKANEPLPEAWIAMATRLLSLPGDHRRLSLVIFARRLASLHLHAGEWCEQFVLSALDEDDASRDAMLAGFFLNPLVFDEKLYRLLAPVMTRLATGELRSPSYSPEGVARFCIGGWLAKTDDGRWLSDDDFRMVLIRSGDTLRTHALWHVRQFEEIDEKLTFLRGVWPLQLSARTPAVVSGLIHVVFDDEAHFPAMTEAVRPLLARTDARTTHLSLLRDKNKRIIAAHPEIVLDLLSGILSDDAANWPYGIANVLESITEARAELSDDPRFRRLKELCEKR